MTKLYELRAYRGAMEVAHGSPMQYALDFQDPEGLRDLLERHLMAVAERAGAHRADAHLFRLEIRELDRGGRSYGEPLMGWALPVPPEDPRR